MNPTADLSILTLVANASLVVKCVLAILVFLSVASWTVIFQKYFTISRAARQVEEFESRFGAVLNSISYLKALSVTTKPQGSKNVSLAQV